MRRGGASTHCFGGIPLFDQTTLLSILSRFVPWFSYCSSRMMKAFVRQITKRSNRGEAATTPTGSQDDPPKIVPATGTTSEARMPTAVTAERATGQSSPAVETRQENNLATLEALESAHPLGKLKILDQKR